MLVIRRREGETLLIGDSVEIRVLEITPARVTFGIAAPREIPVVRGEVLLAGEENRRAAGGATAAALAALAAGLRHPTPPRLIP